MEELEQWCNNIQTQLFALAEKYPLPLDDVCSIDAAYLDGRNLDLEKLKNTLQSRLQKGY